LKTTRQSWLLPRPSSRPRTRPVAVTSEWHLGRFASLIPGHETRDSSEMEPISSFRGWFFCGFVIRQVDLRGGSSPRIRRDAPGAPAKMRPQDRGRGDDGVACALPIAFQWAFWISWAASIKRSMACPGVIGFCRPSALEHEALPVKGTLEMALSAGRYEPSKVCFHYFLSSRSLVVLA